MKIYLAGGMHGDWRGVYRGYTGIKTCDPSQHGLTDSQTYTMWDLTAIDECDILLGFMEADNPGGQGLVLEVGYAKALGKKIILVLEEEFMMQDRYRYFLMATECADVVLQEHEDALKLILALRLVI